MVRSPIIAACALLVLCAAGCPGRGAVKKGPLEAQGPLPASFTVRATGIGRAPDSVRSAGKSRLMAEAAAEADAHKRLVRAIYDRQSGTLRGARRLSAVQIEGGWSLVIVEIDLPTLEDYVIVLDRLGRMEPAVMGAVKRLPGPERIEVIEMPD